MAIQTFHTTASNTYPQFNEDLSTHNVLYDPGNAVIVTTQYINHTDRDIILIDKNGLIAPIIRPDRPPGTVYPIGDFIIRKTYKIPVKCQTLIYKHLSKMETSSPYPEVEAYKQAFMQRYREQFVDNHGYVTGTASAGRTIHVVIDTKITRRELYQYNSIYLKDLELVLTINDIDDLPNHPLNIETLNHLEYSPLLNHTHSRAFIYDLVDNEDAIGRRYLYVSGRVYTLEPKADPNRISGVYFTTFDVLLGEVKKSDLEYYPLQDAEARLGLYRTREEAESGGNPKLLLNDRESTLRNEKLELERQLSESQHQAKLTDQVIQSKEREYRDAKLQHDRQLLEAQQKLKEEERRLTEVEFDYRETENRFKRDLLNQQRLTKELEDELSRRKSVREDYYQERATARKDTSDLLKFMPALISFAGLLIALRLKA